MKATSFNQDMVRALLTCKQCGKMSVPVPCEHCGSTEFVKSQTRRPCRVDTINILWNPIIVNGQGGWCTDHGRSITAPFQVGETRWVRERARCLEIKNTTLRKPQIGRFRYESDKSETSWIEVPDRLAQLIDGNCVPNGCFRELARIGIKITRVWAERVRDISESDAKAEGVKKSIFHGAYEVAIDGEDCYSGDPKVLFKILYDSCYSGSWDRNDWVFACEFERVAI